MVGAAAVTLFVVQLAGVAGVDDHLVPESGFLVSSGVSPYDVALAHAFFPGGADVLRYAQFVVFSTGPDPERAVFIQETDAGGFEVQSVQLNTKLSPDAGVVRRRAPIDQATLEALTDVWNLALDDARFTRNFGVQDGVNYGFADATYRVRGAWTHSPQGQTRITELVALGEALFDYAWQPGNRHKRAGQLRADALRLKEEFAPPSPDVGLNASRLLAALGLFVALSLMAVQTATPFP